MDCKYENAIDILDIETVKYHYNICRATNIHYRDRVVVLSILDVSTKKLVSQLEYNSLEKAIKMLNWHNMKSNWQNEI